MKTLFITGAGTEIGKTLVTTLLVQQLREAGHRVQALKPVVTGFDPNESEMSDSGLLLNALEERLTDDHLARVSPWRFAAPLSPDMAAARENRRIDFRALIAFCKASRVDVDIVLIEGIGGVMVPLDREHTVLDWIEALAAPVVLVVGSYLGTLSHTLTAAGMLEARGQSLAGVIVSASVDQPVPVEETADVMRRFLGPTPVHVLPRLGDGDAAPDLVSLLRAHL